jgi:formamidopyrimidine-DNA glycosylase
VPELPEVEMVRRRIAPVLEGRRLERVEIHDARLVRPYEPAEVAAELTGECVDAVDRRGKYLIVRFESGRALLIHLRMTGSLRHAPAGTLSDDPYRRAVVRLDDGSDVAYRDVRRFGTWHLLEPEEVDPYLQRRLGGEPLDRGFTARLLAERLSGRRAPLKAALLDQRTVAGLGNIYVDEALHRARLHPERRAGGLTPAEVARLRAAMRAVLEEAIPIGGARIYHGKATQVNGFPRVHARRGEPCPDCGGPIEKYTLAGRGTYFCPACQKPTP